LGILIANFNENLEKSNSQESIQTSETPQFTYVPPYFSPLFKFGGYSEDMILQEGIPTLANVRIAPKPDVSFENIAVWDDPQKTIVIKPTFTASAYSEPGFYTYYRQECDESCLTTNIIGDKEWLGTSTGDKTFKILEFLGYDSITDSQLDKNPSILKQYDKIILLHNEYVTRNEFEAIVNHQKVIYLFPNALYAEVKPDYIQNNITLVRGHNYPEGEIKNGFDWKNDNSELEYNVECIDWEFSEVDNGIMLNCTPEDTIIFSDEELLRIIKDY